MGETKAPVIVGPYANPTDAKDTSKEFRRQWTEWFRSPASREAHDTLKQGLPEAQLPKADKATMKTLANIVRVGSRGRLDPGENASAETIEQDLHGMTLDELQSYISHQKAILEGYQEVVVQDRKQGWKRGGAGLQRFSVKFERFLTAYSGVVSIVQMADNQYGGAATAFLTLLYTVANLKVKEEEAINSALDQMADRLPDMDIYQRIYNPDQELARLLANVYVKVIMFSRQATLYFQGHGAARFAKSLRHPQAFQVFDEEMQTAFTKVRLRCDALLAKRISSMEMQLESLAEELAATRKQLEVADHRHDRESVMKLSKALDVAHLGDKKKRLAELHETQVRCRCFADPTEFSSMDLASLERVAEFEKWKSSKTSSMLVLYGANSPGSQETESWLSGAAIEFISTYVGDSSAGKDVADITMVYDLCQRNVSSETVMKGLLAQLLDEHPQVVRRGTDLQNMEIDVQSLSLGREDTGIAMSNPSEAARTRFERLGNALANTLQRVEGRVFFVLNRPEMCKKEYRSLFFETLVALVGDKTLKARLKVLMVVRRDFWPEVEVRIREMDAAERLEEGQLVFCRKDQAELGVY